MHCGDLVFGEASYQVFPSGKEWTVHRECLYEHLASLINAFADYARDARQRRKDCPEGHPD